MRSTKATGGSHPKGSLFWKGSHDGFDDAGALVSYAVPVEGVWEVQAAVGIARVWGSRAVEEYCGFQGCGFGPDTRSVRFDPVVGLPLEVGAFPLDPEERVGVGVTAYVNLNLEEVFGGVLVAVKLRPF